MRAINIIICSCERSFLNCDYRVVCIAFLTRFQQKNFNKSDFNVVYIKYYFTSWIKDDNLQVNSCYLNNKVHIFQSVLYWSVTLGNFRLS